MLVHAAARKRREGEREDSLPRRGGVGFPLTSYVEVGAKPLREALGYHVEVSGPFPPSNLGECDVIVAHSLGASAALSAPPGPRLIFTIDPLAGPRRRCPMEATCVNFYVNFETVPGARNINCADPTSECDAVDAVPILGHMMMSSSRGVWRQILGRLGSI